MIIVRVMLCILSMITDSLEVGLVEYASFAVFHLEIFMGMLLYTLKILFSKWKFMNIKISNILYFEYQKYC